MIVSDLDACWMIHMLRILIGAIIMIVMEDAKTYVHGIALMMITVGHSSGLKNTASGGRRELANSMRPQISTLQKRLQPA